MSSFLSYFLRLGILGFLMMLLSGCFWNGEWVDSSGLASHKWIGFSLRVPASWEKVDSTNITAPVRGNIELALRSLVADKGFRNNLIVLSDTVYSETTASEYVSQSALWASREYLTMKTERDVVLDFDDGWASKLVIFRAKYNEVTAEQIFMQTARICWTKVYLLTIGLENATPADNYDRYVPILESFSC